VENNTLKNTAVGTVKRNNNSDFPLLIDSNKQSFVSLSEHSKHTLDIKALEASLDNVLGCKLSDISLGGGKKQLDVCHALVKRYSNKEIGKDLYLRFSREFFGNNPRPSAMFFQNTDEMSQKVFLMYQLSYAHYILGKYHKMKDSFPSYCCGIAADNVLIAFWEAGIVSAVKVGNDSYDHAYLVVPFVLENQNSEGVIVIDPTSDQLIWDKRKKVRNLVMLITEERWSYVTDWGYGGDLYPEKVEISTCYGRRDVSYGDYLKEAFKNPVVVV